MKNSDDYFEKVHLLATMFAVTGRPAVRRRLIDLLSLPLTDNSKHDILRYELGLLAEKLKEYDPLRGRCRRLARE